MLLGNLAITKSSSLEAELLANLAFPLKALVVIHTKPLIEWNEFAF